jgi:hypothetical protein
MNKLFKQIIWSKTIKLIEGILFFLNKKLLNHFTNIFKYKILQVYSSRCTNGGKCVRSSKNDPNVHVQMTNTFNLLF